MLVSPPPDLHSHTCCCLVICCCCFLWSQCTCNDGVFGCLNTDACLSPPCNVNPSSCPLVSPLEPGQPTECTGDDDMVQCFYGEETCCNETFASVTVSATPIYWGERSRPRVRLVSHSLLCLDSPKTTTKSADAFRATMFVSTPTRVPMHPAKRVRQSVP